jgi:hypothetical protein
MVAPLTTFDATDGAGAAQWDCILAMLNVIAAGRYDTGPVLPFVLKENGPFRGRQIEPPVCVFTHLRFLFMSCAISRWCCKVGRVLPAQSFSFGSSPPFA